MAASGYAQSVSFGSETRYGSACASNKDIGAVQSISPSEKNNLFKVRTLGGNRDYKTVIPGKFEISGSMDYLYQGGAFLRQAFGEDTATTSTVDSGPKILVAGSVYQHVMGSANSPGVNTYPSFTLEFTDYEDSGALATTANLKRTYTGCRVNSLTMSATVDEPLKCSVDWMAKRVTVSTGAKTTITEYTSDPYVFYEGYIYLTSGVATAGTLQSSLRNSAICQVLGFDFTVNNNLESHWYVAGTCSTLDSARSAKVLIPKGRDYELKLNMHYKDRTMYQRFLGAVGNLTDGKTMNKYQIIMDFVKSGTIGTHASGLEYLRLVAASATFDDIAINGAPEDIVNEDITVFAKKVKCYVIDNVSTYE